MSGTHTWTRSATAEPPRLTRDDTLAQGLIDAGKIPTDQLESWSSRAKASEDQAAPCTLDSVLSRVARFTPQFVVASAVRFPDRGHCLGRAHCGMRAPWWRGRSFRALNIPHPGGGIRTREGSAGRWTPGDRGAVVLCDPGGRALGPGPVECDCRSSSLLVGPAWHHVRGSCRQDRTHPADRIPGHDAGVDGMFRWRPRSG